MPIFAYVKNAVSLLCQGKWREFSYRMRVFLVGVDLTNVSHEELNIPVERGHEYANSGGRHLEIVLDTLNITPADAVIDFGSGKGGALITFAKYPFSKITGIELSSALVAIAKRNLKGLGFKNIRMIEGDAADFTELDEYNYFYFFNPFPADIMSAVVKNIVASLVHTPRRAVIVYFNPEFHDAVVNGTPFEKIREFHHHELGYYMYSNKATTRVDIP